MDFIKVRFKKDFDQDYSEFERAFDDMFRSMSPIFTLSQRSWKPPMDIYETEDEVYILAELAGAENDEICIEVSSKAVKISGKRKCFAPVQKARYRLAEIQHGPFERILFLPTRIITESVRATSTNGFLKIRMVKNPPEKTHTIPIEEG